MGGDDSTESGFGFNPFSLRIKIFHFVHRMDDVIDDTIIAGIAG